jgi:hypothetical protein
MSRPFVDRATRFGFLAKVSAKPWQRISVNFWSNRSMPSNPPVSSRLILQTVIELKRRGTTTALEYLEQVEPDLADYVMESLTDIHYHILAMGATAKQSRRIYRRVEMLVLVSIAVLRDIREAPPGAPDRSPPNGA